MTSTRRTGGGRILPHQRDADFGGELLGENIELGESYTLATHNTEQFTILVGTKRKYRNRIKHIYEFWEKEFPEYCSIGVRDLTRTELADSTKYYWKNKKDIIIGVAALHRFDRQQHSLYNI